MRLLRVRAVIRARRCCAAMGREVLPASRRANRERCQNAERGAEDALRRHVERHRDFSTEAIQRRIFLATCQWSRTKQVKQLTSFAFLRERKHQQRGVQLRGQVSPTIVLTFTAGPALLFIVILPRPELHPDPVKWGKNKTCMSILSLGTRPWVNSVRGKRGEGQQGSREASPTSWDWSVCGRLPNEKKDRRCYAEVCCYVERREGLGC